MKVFFVALIMFYLFVTKSMASNAYGKSKNKANGDDSLGLGINSTGPYRQFESGSRRALVNDDAACYTQYFVGQTPPTGFRPSSYLIKHICQNVIEDNADQSTVQSTDEARYATMFDLKMGIAVYAGYLVTREQAEDKRNFPRISKWFQEPDILSSRKGSNKKYKEGDKNIEKGHLVPAATYAFDCISMVSTFTYTNAVPQYAKFNKGSWRTYEGQVRTFAKNCANANGDLYLLTGISEAKVSQDFWSGGVQAEQESLVYFPYNNPHNGENIAIPNSMWTAGCCISRNNGNALGAIAAIGNNDRAGSVMHQVGVPRLQEILAEGTGLKKDIILFPGSGCSVSKQFKLL